MTEAEALAIVSKLESDFARSLTRQYLVRGRLSEKQMIWVYKLAEPVATPDEAAWPSCLAVVLLFGVASANGMKRPSISFPQAKFSLAGKFSRYPGCIQVTEGRYPGKYFGRIETTGQFVPGRDHATLDRVFLSAFSADPVGYAQAHGKESGSCRFCGIPLTTVESVSVGYGPVCAKHWGLPWGK